MGAESPPALQASSRPAQGKCAGRGSRALAAGLALANLGPVALPPGSNQIAAWAASARLGYEPTPDEAWFRRWEPHDTIAPPTRFYNSCTWQARPDPGHVVVVEPWYALDEMEPLQRVVVAFAVHPALRFRASMRAGEHFVRRAAFIESPPPPEVKLGDAVWDENVVTFAATPGEAASAFHPRLRRLLVGWPLRGHLELRPGGMVVYYGGLVPSPEGYERLLRITQEIVARAIAYHRG